MFPKNTLESNANAFKLRKHNNSEQIKYINQFCITVTRRPDINRVGGIYFGSSVSEGSSLWFLVFGQNKTTGQGSFFI